MSKITYGDYQVYMNGSRILFTDCSAESSDLQTDLMNRLESQGIEYTRRVTLVNSAHVVYIDEVA